MVAIPKPVKKQILTDYEWHLLKRGNTENAGHCSPVKRKLVDVHMGCFTITGKDWNGEKFKKIPAI